MTPSFDQNLQMSVAAASTFAKILASENLHVEFNPTLTTAQMDVENRILSLPVFENMSEQLIHMFILHEISHALFTPVDFREKIKDLPDVFFGILNICEDVRIERFVKAKYPGSLPSFFHGYEELLSGGFFGNDTPFQNMILVDRINVFFKVNVILEGQGKGIKFAENEKHFLVKLAQAETFEQILEIAKELFAHEQQAAQQKSDLKSGKGKDGKPSDKLGNGQPGDEIVVETDVSSKKFLKEKVVRADGIEYKSIGLETNMNNMVVSWQNVHQSLSASRKKYRGRTGNTLDFGQKITQWKQENSSLISQLVCDFERQKAADHFKHRRITDTGTLNMSRLHDFKFSDNIFLQSTNCKDGKKHGLVILVDWSSSMRSVASSIIHQAMLLADFCRKIGIPYDIYAFNNISNPAYANVSDKELHGTETSSTKLVHWLSSKMSVSEHGEAIMNLRFIQHAFGERNILAEGISIPPEFQMGGTPTITSLIFMASVIPEFKKFNHVEIMNFVFLTDGAATDSVNSSAKRVIVEDRIINRSYVILPDHEEETIFNIIRDRCNGACNMVGYDISYYKEGINSQKFDMVVQDDKFDTRGVIVYTRKDKNQPSGYDTLYVCNNQFVGNARKDMNIKSHSEKGISEEIIESCLNMNSQKFWAQNFVSVITKQFR